MTAAALTVLGWGIVKFKNGYAAAGQLSAVYRSLRNGLDYLVTCVGDDLITVKVPS